VKQENKTPQASMPTDPTPTPIIYNYNHANEYFQKDFIGNPFGYVSDIFRLWYMNDLK
jgi:ABC-type polysaccharide/polyol phosphate export permease